MDLFISYAHEDAEFVERLRAALTGHGHTPWVDTEGIQPSDRWRGSAQEAVERCDAFLFVLSRASLGSAACLEELDYAVSLNKRLIAICVEEAVADMQKPHALDELSWIMMRPQDEFDRGVETLLRALETDLELVRTHTRVLVRARAWELGGRRASPLLRGEELRNAEEWLSRAALGGGPQPTELQREFIVASRRAATRRHATIAGVSAAVAVLALVLSAFALIQRSDAINNQHIAQSRLLASEAENTIASDASLSTLLALRALRIRDTFQAEEALRDALANLQALTVLRGFVLKPNTAVYSPDGSRVLTGSDDGTVALWDPRTAARLKTIRVSKFIVSDAVYSRDGTRIATASRDGTARIFDVTTGRLLAVMRSPAHMDTVAFSPDGSRIVTGSDGGIVRVWEASGGRLVMTLRTPGQFSEFATYTPDGTKILTDSELPNLSYRVQLWDASTGRELSAFSPHQQAGGVAISPDGTRVALDTAVYDIASGRQVSHDLGSLLGGDSDAFSPDGARVLSISSGAQGEIWSARSGVPVTEVGPIGSGIESGTFSPDGSRVVTASDERVATIWNARSYTQLLTLSEGGNDASFSRDGSMLLTVADDGTISLSNAADGTLLRRFRDPSQHAVTAVLSPDGSKIFTYAGEFGPPRLVDARTGRELLRFPVPRAPPILFGALPARGDASFSPDGSKLAYGTITGLTLIWALRRGPPVMKLRGPANTPVEDAEFSHDGTRLVTANDDGTARVWDATTGRQLLVLKTPSTADFAAEFSPDDEKIATACADGTARIWDARTGRQLLVLTGHSDAVNWVAFSPDGSKLATASDDQTVRIWNAYSGQRLVTFTRQQPITHVMFNASGSAFVTSDENGTTVYSTALASPITSLIRLARSLVTRPFTRQERAEYLAGISG